MCPVIDPSGDWSLTLSTKIFYLEFLSMKYAYRMAGKFAESSVIRQPKLVLTIKNLLADLVIRQTFFRQMLEKSQFAKPPPPPINFPTIWYFLSKIPELHTIIHIRKHKINVHNVEKRSLYLLCHSVTLWQGWLSTIGPDDRHT